MKVGDKVRLNQSAQESEMLWSHSSLNLWRGSPAGDFKKGRVGVVLEVSTERLTHDSDDFTCCRVLVDDNDGWIRSYPLKAIP